MKAGGLDGLAQLPALFGSGREPGILLALDLEFVAVEELPRPVQAQSIR
jgi:hypothetical protein